MTVQPDDVYEILRNIRKDLSAAQSKITDAFRALDALNLPTQPSARCEACGLDFRGQNTLAEHVYSAHEGPLPAHWARADDLAGDPA